MDFVTLVNRTEQNCEGTWDGRPYLIQPGPSSHPKILARKFREQNPVMGSEDPRTGSMIYKLGVKEDGDDIRPLTPTFLAQYGDAIERWDRSKLTGARPSEVVPGDNGLYNVKEWRSAQPLASGGEFTRPD